MTLILSLAQFNPALGLSYRPSPFFFLFLFFFCERPRSPLRVVSPGCPALLRPTLQHFSHTNAGNFTTALTRGTDSGLQRHSSLSMRSFSPLSGLPASLLLLLTQLLEVHGDTQRLPTAIRKMGIDAGEKFLQEYYAFEVEDGVAQVGTEATSAPMPAQGILTPEDEARLLAAVNSSTAIIPYRAPFAAHFYGSQMETLGERDSIGEPEGFREAKWAEVRLAKRDFACPTGTSDCSSIGYPNSCCQSGTTCVKISDTGLGPVGCCPNGESCTGQIACSGDQEGCSSASGGGCCISGYACASIGCK